MNLTKTLRTTYDWSIDRMNELCTDGDIEQLKDAVSIRQEFAEWLLREDKEIHHEIVSLEYMEREVSLINEDCNCWWRNIWLDFSTCIFT